MPRAVSLVQAWLRANNGRARRRCHRGDAGVDALGVVHRDERHVRLGDARLFRGDLGEAVTEEGLMIDAERSDPGDRGGDDVGRIETPAETDF